MFSLGVGEINTHVQTVYTKPSPSPILEGLGTRLNLVWTPLHAWKCLAGIWMKLHWYTVDWGYFMLKNFRVFYFHVVNIFIAEHTHKILNTSKRITCIALLLQLPPCCCSWAMLTSQFQTAERACTWKDHAYIQPWLELTNHFSNCFGRYGKR